MEKKTIMILTPTGSEAGFIEHSGGRFYLIPENRAEYGADEPAVYNAGIPVTLCGVGMAEAAASAVTAIKSYRPDVVILAGIAGAYPESGLRPGQCVLVGSERVSDLGAFRDGRFTPLYQKEYTCQFAGKIKSLPRAAGCTVSAAAGDFAAADGSGSFAAGGVESMEGAGFFAVCMAQGVEFYEVRAVSNMTDDPRSEWRMDEAVRSLAGGLIKLTDEINA